MKKPGRNDPCRCGSGKKYKHCHQSIDEGASATPTAQPSQAEAARLGQLAGLGNTYLADGRLEDAASAYRKALALHPDHAQLLCNLGSVLDSLGQPDEAIACYRHALALHPEVAEIHNNLGLALQAQGRLEEAVACYRRALQLNPAYTAGHFNLGRTLQTQGKHEDAVASYRRMLALDPNYAQAHSNLGFSLEEIGQLEDSVASYRQAIAIDPTLLAAHKGLTSALRRLVPEWHVPMMNDTLRNEAYYAALRAAVTPESDVFEIGTGSGLLSMMAAKAGAKSVTTCEAEPIIAATAREIIADNGLAERIKVIPKKSTEVTVGGDLARPASLMVSEILSSELLGERVLSSIEDARRRLLKPGCRMIPAAGSIMLALFGGDELGANLAASESCGFDLRRFNNIVPQRQNIARNDLAVELLSADTAAFRFDFENTPYTPPEEKTLRLPVTAAGRCLGLVQWMRLEMYEDIVFENHPAVKAAAYAWTRCAYLFPTPVDVKPGQVAVIAAAHNRIFPWFTLIGIE